MNDRYESQTIVATLRAVAKVLRAYAIADLLDVAVRLERIATRMDQIQASLSPSHASDRTSDLIGDTLRMLETFREIDNPAVRQAAISVVSALRLEPDK